MATTISPLAKKLGLKPGMRATVLRAPEGVLSLLEPLPDGASVTIKAGGTADLVLLFAADMAALTTALPDALAAGKPGGLLWVAYPKGGTKAGTDLNRDILWRWLQTQDLTGVTLVAVDGIWSALRVRPTDEVGT